MSLSACPEALPLGAQVQPCSTGRPQATRPVVKLANAGAGGGPTGPVRDVLRLALPATLHLLLLTAVFMADRALVGRASSAGLASLQVSSTLSWSLCSIAAALGVGAGARVAHAIGAGSLSKARGVTRLALVAAVLAGLATLAAGLPLATLIVDWLSPTPPAVRDAAIGYLKVVLLVMPFAFVDAVAVSCLHAAGDTRTPLRAAVAANAVNLCVSAALVFGWGGLPALGAVGAAIGTAVALMIQAIWLCYRLQQVPAIGIAKRAQQSWRQQLHADLAELGPLWRVVWPAAGEKAIYHGGYLLYAAAVTTLGASAMAANQSLVSIEALGFTVAEGCGIAAATIAGQHMGAGRPREAVRTCVTASTIAAVLLTFVGMAMAAAPDVAIAAFCNDPSVVVSGRQALLLGWLWSRLARPGRLVSGSVSA